MGGEGLVGLDAAAGRIVPIEYNHRSKAARLGTESEVEDELRRSHLM
jgi:hypothetical protein